MGTARSPSAREIAPAAVDNSTFRGAGVTARAHARSLRKLERPTAASANTRTITVDLGDRQAQLDPQ